MTSKIESVPENSLEIYQYNRQLWFTVSHQSSSRRVAGVRNREVAFICPKHRMPFVHTDTDWSPGFKLECLICERENDYAPLEFLNQKYEDLQKKALALLDGKKLKEAKLIRLDDFYIPEIAKFDALKGEETDYFLKADVKTDADGDTVVVIYVGNKNKNGKSQFFIKPEKLQLSHDFHDLDPAEVLAKIELTLKDRVIRREYDAPESDSGK